VDTSRCPLSEAIDDLDDIRLPEDEMSQKCIFWCTVAACNLPGTSLSPDQTPAQDP
jgi:hypothetical protein